LTVRLSAGDEYGHSRGGNNNWYGHDNAMTHFNWKATDEQEAFKRFYAAACNFRRECPLLGREEFLTPEDITWHDGDWENDASKFISFTLHGRYTLLAAEFT
jgi:isoamylase